MSRTDELDKAIAHLMGDADLESIAHSLFASQAVRLKGRVESPIELLLGMALLSLVRLIEDEEQLCFLQTQENFEKIVKIGNRRHIYIIPQYKWQSYRSDFLIATTGGKFLVECDGHDFHERTKKQAAHDRKRDREAQRLGYVILRFTGSEIFASPFACCQQIISLLISRRAAAESDT